MSHPPATTTATLALGSNLGNRQAHLDRALAAIAALPGVEQVTPSRYYETAPVGPQDQGAFLNAAARIQTTLSPEDLLAALLTLERRLGRPPREKRQHWGPREIDLDLLLYGNIILNSPKNLSTKHTPPTPPRAGLTLPHPRMHERWFVLRPLCDVAAEAVHPLLGKTIRQLLEEVQEPQKIQEPQTPPKTPTSPPSPAHAEDSP